MVPIKERILHIVRNELDIYLDEVDSIKMDNMYKTYYQHKSSAEIRILKTIYVEGEIDEVEIFYNGEHVLKFAVDCEGEECISNGLIYVQGEWEYAFY